MENDLLLNRYVAGLKMVSWVFALLQLVVVFTNLLLPTANTNFGQFAYPTIFLVAFLANSAIAILSIRCTPPVLFICSGTLRRQRELGHLWGLAPGKL